MFCVMEEAFLIHSLLFCATAGVPLFHSARMGLDLQYRYVSGSVRSLPYYFYTPPTWVPWGECFYSWDWWITHLIILIWPGEFNLMETADSTFLIHIKGCLSWTSLFWFIFIFRFCVLITDTAQHGCTQGCKHVISIDPILSSSFPRLLFCSSDLYMFNVWVQLRA